MSSSGNGGSGGQAGRSMPAPPLNMMPPFFPFLPFNIPPPRPPVNFAAMTDSEVRQMEGNERQHIEARIQVLRNIQTLLDAAVVQMNQYASVVAAMDLNSEASTQAAQKGTTREATPAPEAEPRASDSKEAAKAPLTASQVTSLPTTNGETSKGEGSDENEETAGSAATPAAPDSSTPDPHDPQEELRRRRLERFTHNS